MEVTKPCNGACGLEKERSAFSKTQWGRANGRCAECIANEKREQTDEGGKELEGPVDDEVIPLCDHFEELFERDIMRAPETLAMQPDQACCDRGRPGTCTSLEYVLPHVDFDASEPFLDLHPLLFLRSMSYVGHYQKEGLTFATPALNLFGRMRDVPPRVEALLSSEDAVVFATRVWLFPNAPPSINIISHGFVFQHEPQVKIHRNVQMGAFSCVGVSQHTLAVGKLLSKVRVSVHRAKGLMACSPNNAILRLEPEPELRRFWCVVRDGSRVEVTLNVLYVEDALIHAFQKVVQSVAQSGSQTHFRDLCHHLAPLPAFHPLLCLLAAHH